MRTRGSERRRRACETARPISSIDVMEKGVVPPSKRSVGEVPERLIGVPTEKLHSRKTPVWTAVYVTAPSLARENKWFSIAILGA